MRGVAAAAAIVVAAVTGCTTYAVGVPTDEHGKAYVVRSQRSRQDIYLCTVTNGNPVCTQQRETR
jgi:hypothetical protein